MAEVSFSNRELELLFKRIDEKLDDIRQDIKDTNNHFDTRLSKVERKVERMETWHAKVMTLWSAFLLAASIFANYLIGRFLP
jgi:predicted component of type VI protein secretion system